MGSKYKLRKKKKYNAFMLLIIVFILTITMSAGYSIWSISLNINANVFLNGDNEFQLVPVDEDDGGGSGGGDVDDPSYIISTMPPNDGTLEGEILEDNRLIVNYRITEKTGTPRTVYYTLNFIDNAPHPLSNITTSYTITGNRDAIDGNVVITMPQSVSAGGSASISIATPLKLNKLNTSVTVTCKITYTVNNVQKDFYIEFRYYK